VLSCLRSLFCCSRPARQEVCAPKFPSHLDVEHERESLAYLNHLASDRFHSETHSSFPTKTTKDLNEISRKVKAYEPSSCCACFSSCHCLSVLCTSKTAKAAMGAGLLLGASSVYVGYITTSQTAVILGASGLLAGTANCMGTYLGLVDSAIRSSTEDKYQDMHYELSRHFESLALFLLTNHLQQVKAKKISGAAKAEQGLTDCLPLATKLLSNEAQIRASIEKFFPRTLEERFEENLAEELFEVVRYVVSGTKPRSHVLINQIATFDSPSMEEHLELRARFEALSRAHEAILRRLDAAPVVVVVEE
jgi:hypothetical protein